MPRKCYLGCRGPKKLTIHSFPNPRTHLDQLKAWVEVVGGKLETDADYVKYRKSSICDAHFTLKDRNRFSRLNALAVPSLYLDGDLSKAPPSLFSPPASSPPPAPPPAPAETAEDPLAETEVTGTGDLSKAPPALFSSPPPSPPRAPPLVPSETSEDPLADTEVTGTVIAKDITEDINDSSSQQSLKKLSTSVKVFIETFQPTHDLKTTPDCTTEDVADAPPRSDTRLTQPEPTKTDHFPVQPFCRICQARSEHNYPRDVLKEEKNRDIKLAASSEHPDTEVSRLSMLVKKLQTQLKSSKTQIYKLKKHNRLIKDKMAEMRKNHSTDIINKVTRDMTPAGRILMKMQFTQTKKAAPGRRFSPEEKALAISMFNSSPSGYSVLSKFLTLPSRKHIRKHFLNLQQGIKQESEVMKNEDEIYKSEDTENEDQMYESEVMENDDQIYECEVMKNEDQIYESEVIENEDQIYESEVIENEDQIYESEVIENEDQIYESEVIENEDQIYESEVIENEDQIYESEVMENDETMCIDNVVNEITLRDDSSGQTCVVEERNQRTLRVALSELSYDMPEI